MNESFNFILYYINYKIIISFKKYNIKIFLIFSERKVFLLKYKIKVINF